MKRLIFSTRLSELMKNAKVTQQDLASYIGTTRQAISKYADGSVQPNIEKMYKIAKFFDVSADYLLGLESDSAKATIEMHIKNAQVELLDRIIGFCKSLKELQEE